MESRQSPSEVIDQRDAGAITDQEMLDLLVGMTYTYDHHPDGGHITHHALVRGTWHEVEQAFDAERLTYEQFSAIVLAHVDELKKAASQQ